MHDVKSGAWSNEWQCYPDYHLTPRWDVAQTHRAAVTQETNTRNVSLANNGCRTGQCVPPRSSVWIKHISADYSSLWATAARWPCWGEALCSTRRPRRSGRCPPTTAWSGPRRRSAGPGKPVGKQEDSSYCKYTVLKSLIQSLTLHCQVYPEPWCRFN